MTEERSRHQAGDAIPLLELTEEEKKPASVAFNIDDGLQSNQPASKKKKRNTKGSIFHFNERIAAEDEGLLQRTVKDAGIGAFGVVLVECWVLSIDGTRLTRPDGGQWMNPCFVENEQLDKDALVEFEEANSAISFGVGEGLAGSMYKESVHHGSSSVKWRQIRSLERNPFIPNGRVNTMRTLLNLEIGLVGTVAFRLQKRNGIVMFMSRSTADIDKLRCPNNEDYLRAATNLVGAAFAVRIPKIKAAKLKRQQFQAAVDRVRENIRPKQFKALVGKVSNKIDAEGRDAENAKKFKEVLDAEANESSALVQQVKTNATYLKDLVNKSTKKWSGTNAAAPPREQFREASFTFFGIYIVMMLLLYFKDFLQLFVKQTGGVQFNEGWFIGPLGLIYNLTAGPPGAPRQVVGAQIFNITLSMALRNVPWLTARVHTKKALIAALGISGQAYLGLVHPPAASLAYAFANMEKLSWGNLVGVLLADVIVIAFTVAYLNIPQRSQYPMFWTGSDFIQKKKDKEKEKKNMEKGKKTTRMKSMFGGWVSDDFDEHESTPHGKKTRMKSMFGGWGEDFYEHDSTPSERSNANGASTNYSSI